MSLIVNKPYPIKICYLKNEQKPVEQEQQQKVSLTFLSSFIQQQKKFIKNQEQYNSFMITEEDNDNVQFNTNPQPVNTPAYERWRKRKTKSSNEDKRLLTNLIGNNWSENSGYISQNIGFNSLKKNKKTLKQRLQTFQDDQRKKTNKNMMQSHFKTFLSDKKHDPISPDPIESTCFVTKIDQRTYQSLNPSLASRIKGYNLKIKRAASINYNSNALSEIKMRRQTPIIRNNNSFSLGSTLRRHGFKEIANFKWSKLSDSQKFKLNDHS